MTAVFRPRIALAVLAAVAVTALPACQSDDPANDLPCEFYRTAPSNRPVPEECREELGR
jgi:hypothetical protein